MTPIAGANSYYYLSEISGSYYVEITNQSCTASSSCHWVQIPTADFEGTPTSGDAPLLVAFTDLSVDSVSTWQWDFGDGNTSTDQNPTNEYVNPGFYTVTLIIVGPGGSDTLIKPDYIQPTYTSPTADFEGVPTSGVAPLEVTFTDLSVDSVNTWVWDFGDGSTSVYQSPVYTYTAAGTYTVSLTVGGPGGSDEMIKTDYITVSDDVPVANFEGTPTTGNTPLSVNFSDLSYGNINTWYWDFGDGDSSSVQNPEHEYITSGSFTVSLTVTGPGGSNQMVKTDYIVVTTDAPIADFEGTPTFGEAPLLVNFADLSTGNINTWSWNFGDGDSSSVQNPAHEYMYPGNFTVSLTATGYGGSDTEVKVDYILIPVGISENHREAIVVYPNPVTNKLHIIFTDAKSRSIIMKNTNGKQIFEKISVGKEEVINLQQYGQGVYLLIIKDDNNNVSVVKVVKK
jgi:PKD repeat protein